MRRRKFTWQRCEQWTVRTLLPLGNPSEESSPNSTKTQALLPKKKHTHFHPLSYLKLSDTSSQTNSSKTHKTGIPQKEITGKEWCWQPYGILGNHWNHWKKKPETNITPENRPCQEEMSSSNHWFLRATLASGRVTWIFVMCWPILEWERSSHLHAWTLASSSSFAASTSSKRCTSPGSCCCNVAILCENREGVLRKKKVLQQKLNIKLAKWNHISAT